MIVFQGTHIHHITKHLVFILINMISWSEHSQIKLDITKAATQCKFKATSLNALCKIFTPLRTKAGQAPSEDLLDKQKLCKQHIFLE